MEASGAGWLCLPASWVTSSETASCTGEGRARGVHSVLMDSSCDLAVTRPYSHIHGCVISVSGYFFQNSKSISTVGAARSLQSAPFRWEFVLVQVGNIL